MGDVDDDGDLEIFAAYLGGEPGTPIPNSVRFHRQVAVDVGDLDTTQVNRAMHVAKGSQLGSLRDTDSLSQATGSGREDDNLGPLDDEDGVIFDAPIRAGQLDAHVTVLVQTSTTASLDAWIDFNDDGIFGGPGERIAAALVLDQGEHQIEFSVPNGTVPGQHSARFRLTDAPADSSLPKPASPVGLLSSGEVEDHLVEILPAKPVGAWTYSAVSTGGSTVNQTALGDLNGDGLPDLISTSDGVYWQINQGNGSWGSRRIIVPAGTGTEYTTVTVVDLDQDGEMDIVAAQVAPSDRLSWFQRKAGAIHRYDIPTGQSDIRKIIPTDFDQDGDLDLLVASHGDQVVQLYVNDGSLPQEDPLSPPYPFETSPIFALVVPTASDIAVGDLDGDGDLDVAATSSLSGLYWIENRGPLTPDLHGLQSGFFSRVSMADLDDDGDLDLVVASPSGVSKGTYWYENEGGSKKTFQRRTIESDATVPSEVIPADMNADGHLDIVRFSTTSDSQTIFLSDGANRPNFTPWEIASGPAAASVAVSGNLADADRDGDLDLVTVDILGNVHAFFAQDPGDAPFAIDGAPTVSLGYVEDEYGPGSVYFTFSETVTGLDLGDLQLQRGTDTIDLSDAALEKLTSNEFRLYLPAAARHDGDYTLTLTASGSGIEDAFGELFIADASESWTQTVFSVVFADPIATPVAELPDITIEFSEPPNSVALADFQLIANGLPQSLASLQLASDSATRYTLPLSQLVAPPDGEYELVFSRVGANIFTVDAHPLTNSLSAKWTLDTAAPRVRMLYDVSSRPHAEPFYGAFVRFSENMFNRVYASNLHLVRDGVEIDLSDIRIEQENFRDFEIELQPYIQESGDYTFTIGPAADSASDFLKDRAGNRMDSPLVVPFTIDRDPPTASFQPPVPGGQNRVVVEFAEPVVNLDVSDFRLSRNGAQLELAETALAMVDGTESTYLVQLPATATGSGEYTLSLFTSIADVEDLAGNRMRATSEATWNVDVVAPTVNVLDVTPSMRQISVGLVTFEFSEPVSGFDVQDVVVSRDGVPIFAPHLELLRLTDKRYGVDLSRITTISGDYTVTLDPATAGIRDAAENALATTDTEAFSIMFVDGDADSIGDVIEARAPNAGDGNGDNTPDAEQAHVASLPAPQDGTYVTVVADQNQTLADVQIIEEPVADGAPDDIDFRLGFLDYDLTGVPVGGSTVVTIFLEDATNVNNYYKFGPTPNNHQPHWYRFNFDSATGTGAKFLEDRIELHLIDGERGDDDLTANGVIVDPGAPASDLRAAPWQNPFDPLDINEDGQVTATDLDLLTAELDQNGPRALPVSSRPDVVDRFWDVSGDNQLSREDVWLLNFALFQLDPTQGSLIVTTASDRAFSGALAPTSVSLREALSFANETPGNQTIVVDSSLVGQVFHLEHGQLAITDDVTLLGLGANTTIVTARGADAASATSRVLSIAAPQGQEIDVTLDGLTITGGKTGANEPGGGIYFDSPGTLTVMNSTISANAAEAASGGGIYAARGDVAVINSSVLGNIANGDGGGIASFGKLSVTESRVLGNQAIGNGNGGGLFVLDGEILVVDSEISGNQSNFEGGGIRLYNLAAQVTVVGSTIHNNRADYGGGISSDHVTLWNSTISDNEADLEGGGIFSYDGTLVVANSTLSGNQTPGRGGGIWGRFGTVTISNSTIAFNDATLGGGVYAPTTLLMRNTIVAQNTSDNEGADLVANAGDADIRHSLIGDNTGNPLPESRTPDPVSGNLVGDPDVGGLLVPGLSPLGDYGGTTRTHLLTTNSPAIDRGDNTATPPDTFDADADADKTESLPYDQRGGGFDRLRDGDANGTATVDMGAVEFEPLQLSLTIVPDSIREDGSTGQATVSRSGALSSELIVTLASSDTGEARVPATVTIAAGQATSSPFTVTGQRDLIVDGPQTVTITATASGHLGSSDSLTITDVDTAAVTISDATAVEGDNLTFTVTLDNAVAGGTQVHVTLAGGTATGGASPLVAPEDYDNLVPVLNFSGVAGEQRQFNVSTLLDSQLEDDETFFVSLQSTNSLVTASDTAIGTITDNSDTGLPYVELDVSATAIPEAGGVATVTARLVNRFGATTSAGVDGVSVALSFGGAALGGGIDYIASAATINIPAGGDHGSITLTAVQDSLADANELLTIDVADVLHANSTGASQVTTTIIDDDASSDTIVLLTLEISDTDGNPLPDNRVTVGESFRMNALVKDTRFSPEGIFAAYLDVAYSESEAFSVVIPEQQRLTLPRDTTGGTYQLVLGGIPTDPIQFGATPAESAHLLRLALEGHPQVGDGNVNVAPTSRTEFTETAFFTNRNVFDIVFRSDLADVDVALLTANGSGLLTSGGPPTAEIEGVANGGDSGAFQYAFVPSPEFGQGISGFDESGEFGEVGSFCRILPCLRAGLPGDTELLWSVELVANVAGSLEFVANPADDTPAHDLLVLGRNNAVPLTDVVFGAAQVHIVDRMALDYGDAADPRYRTTFDRNGARHNVGALFLGAGVDAEFDANSSPGADGDSSDDGVVWPASLIAHDVAVTSSSMVVTSSAAGLLDAWIDFNLDGDWSDLGEQISISQAVNAGSNVLPFTVPAGATPGDTVARVRLSTQGGLAPTGPAADGEVEDYLVTLADGNTAGGTSVRLDLPFAGSVSVVGVGQEVSVRMNSVELFRAPGSVLTQVDIVGTAGDDAIQVANLTTSFSGRVTVDGGLGNDVLTLSGGGQTIDLLGRPSDWQGLERIDIRGSGNNTLILDVEAAAGLPASTGQLAVLADLGDTVDLGTGWSLRPPQLIDGEFFRVLEPAAGIQNITLLLNGPSNWQHPLQPLDVNNNGLLADPVGDILPLINELNRQQIIDHQARLPMQPASTVGFLHYDVNGDGLLTPVADILALINYTNARSGGEGETRVANLDAGNFNWFVEQVRQPPLQATAAPNADIPANVDEFFALLPADPIKWSARPRNEHATQNQAPRGSRSATGRADRETLEDWITAVDDLWQSEIE